MAARYGLIADVGGTNIRLALYDFASGTRDHTKKYLCAEYPTIVDVIKQYLADVSVTDVKEGCLAIACPTDEDWISMTNHTWQFSVKEATKQLGFDHLHFINDFTAISQSLPVIAEDKLLKIGGGEVLDGAPKAVLGAGTGLGVAHIIHLDGRWLSLPGEGGHVDFAATNDKEVAVWRYLSKKYSRVSYEQLLSGLGLTQIYQALNDVDGKQAESLTPAEVCDRALDGSCEYCVSTLALFCNVMGSMAGNLALTMATFGGVYVAGGIAPRFPEFFANSRFRERFEAKGRFNKYLQRIPTFLVLEEQPGLVGAGAYLSQAQR